MYPVITISREYGSGGRAIGQKVAEKLGVPFLDRDIIRKAAEATGISEQDVEKVSETAGAVDKFVNSSFAHGLYLEADQDKVFRAQADIIIEQAEKGPCVIVGRCSDYVLAHENIDALNVFIHAGEKFRVEKAVSEYGLKEASAEREVRKIDKRRRYYYRYYTDQDWGDYENFQLILDSGYLGEDLCVELILAAVKDR